MVDDHRVAVVDGDAGDVDVDRCAGAHLGAGDLVVERRVPWADDEGGEQTVMAVPANVTELRQRHAAEFAVVRVAGFFESG